MGAVRKGFKRLNRVLSISVTEDCKEKYEMIMARDKERMDYEEGVELISDQLRKVVVPLIDQRWAEEFPDDAA